MSTSAVNNSDYWLPPSSDSSANTTTTKGSSNISDFNSFMKILAIELQNQDPTDPVSNTEYVSQLAQVQSLSQLQNISNTVTAAGAYEMIGKTVTYQTTDSATGAATADSGTVQAVITKDNTTYLLVNGQMVEASSVIMVSPAPTSDDSSSESK